jgi:hypothetical protein
LGSGCLADKNTEEGRGQSQCAGGAQQQSTPSDQTEFSHGLKIGQHCGEEGQHACDCGGEDGGAGGGGGTDEGVAGRGPGGIAQGIALALETADQQDCIIPHADQHDRKSGGEEIEVAHGQRGETQGPDGTCQQGQTACQGRAPLAENPGVQGEHA